MITARHLRVFYEVCKHMNMTKASKALYLSQPAVSKTIHDLEERYGVQLFERYNKALYLTPAGFMLLDYAKQVVNLLDTIDANMQSADIKEVIRVGASITVGTSIMADIVTGFNELYKDVRIDVTVDGTKAIEEDLLQGKLDIAIIEGNFSSTEIHSDVVGSTETVLVVNEQHKFYSRENISAKDLEGENFIVREKGSRTRENFAAAMEKNNVKWKISWACHNTQAIKNAVDAGLGIGVLSKLSVRKRLDSGRFKALNVFDEPLKLYIRLAYLNNKYFSNNLTAFREYAERKIAELERR